ncbi:hypothetical protein H8356DRAFT_1088341 [Neocallimastix lanati (nom. inval.)]|nr:hypothetical protein H8356DRAFT_1088341 [Neocallimastix sp. JGI-2020a]
MEYTDEDGYVIDSSGGSKKSIIIYCNKDGENCYIINPNQINGNGHGGLDNNSSNKIPKTVYYTNGNNLIKCTNGICVKVSVKPGNYLRLREKMEYLVLFIVTPIMNVSSFILIVVSNI